jgi:hypothetical protein
MKSKVVKLLDKGLSKKLISNLTESQINLLITKMGLSETTMVSKADTQTINKLKNERKPFEVYEKEMKEDEEDPMNFEKRERTQDPHQVGPSTDDGFGNYDDGTGEFNEIKKSDNKQNKLGKVNPLQFDRLRHKDSRTRVQPQQPSARSDRSDSQQTFPKRNPDIILLILIYFSNNSPSNLVI